MSVRRHLLTFPSPVLTTCTRCYRKMLKEKGPLRILFPVLILVLVLLAYMPHSFVFHQHHKLKGPYLWKGCLHNLTAWLRSSYSHAFADGVYISSAFEVPGIGNMMFQYASLLGIAQRTGRSPVVPRDLQLLQYFDLSALCTTDQRPGLGWGKLVEMKSSSYDHKIATINSPVNLELVGFFQSWKYFQDFEPILRQDFAFNPTVLQPAFTFLNASGLPTTTKSPIEEDVGETGGQHGQHSGGVRPTLIGVHVRRGDMADQRFADLGYTIADPAYIQRAMRYFEAKFPNIVYVVCSDDIAWCRDHVVSEHHPAVYSQSLPAEVDLAILSLCDHTIMTVGTFGWWAGWLAGGEVTYFKDFPRANSRLEISFSQSKQDYFYPDWVGL